FAQFASDLDQATRNQLERGRRVTELMKQAQFAPLSVAQLAITLFAVNKGYFDDVEVGKLLAMEGDLHKYVEQQHGALYNSILEKAALDADGEKELADAIEAFKKTWS